MPAYPSYQPARSGSRAYQQIGLETEVLGASPQRLISLLLRAALRAIRQARHHMQRNEPQARGMALSRAIEILESGLKASVDTERGGEVARSLNASYELIIRHLMLANLRNSAEHLDTAEQALGPIAQAWHSAIDPDYQGLAPLLETPSGEPT
ncbi:MAG: flagellar export chaperone FliS [Burkholderiaceae bacterium]|uniref:flagellar export chaperone FliS n=1 Tax=Castellaniella sp. TaxID=1955812 RepID=UPI00355EF9FF